MHNTPATSFTHARDELLAVTRSTPAERVARLLAEVAHEAAAVAEDRGREHALLLLGPGEIAEAVRRTGQFCTAQDVIGLVAAAEAPREVACRPMPDVGAWLDAEERIARFAELLVELEAIGLTPAELETLRRHLDGLEAAA